MALGLREIADILLKYIFETIGENDHLDMNVIYEHEEYVKFGNKIHKAIKYLEENGFIDSEGSDAEDGILYQVTLTSKGVLYCEDKGWCDNKEAKEENITNEVTVSELSMREISILLLEVIGKFHEKDPYTSGYDFNEVSNSEEIKQYKNELRSAALLLEEDNYAKCYYANDGNISSIGLTTSGERRLEQRLETITKPSEIDIIIKDLMSESNPDRPRDMEKPQTNAFYDKVNFLGITETKINFLQEVLDGIEEYFIKKWTKGKSPGNFINGFPMKAWKKNIREYDLYKKIKRMIETLIDDPKHQFAFHYKSYTNAYKDLEKYRKEEALERKQFWEEHLFIDIIEIKEYLKKLKDAEKLEFLDFQLHELNQICYHYNDDAIETTLQKHNLQDKFKRVKYSAMTDFEHSHISKSEYIVFLTLLSKNIIPFLKSELRRLKGSDGNPKSETGQNDEVDNEAHFPEKVYFENSNISMIFKNPYILTEITGFIIDNNKHFAGQVINLTDSEYKEYVKSVKIEPYGKIWKAIIEELQEYDNYPDKINCLTKVKAKFEFDKAYPTGNNTFINYINDRLAEYLSKQKSLRALEESTPLKETIQAQDANPIQWHGNKGQLLELFKLLNENKPEYTANYNQNEIFNHFVDERGNKYIDVREIQTQYLQWKTTDGEFWQLVNLLVENKFINKHKKYQVFIPHFLNKELQKFKNPAQTTFFKKTFSNPDDNLIQIINKVLLIKD